VQLISIEEHFLTTEIRDAWNAMGLDAVDPSVAFHSGMIEVGCSISRGSGSP